jgi:Lar family restriction alleviation protein
MDPELKPCPFCGSTDVHLIENGYGKSEVSITCKDCNVWVDHMFDAMSKEEAIALWNRRVSE